VKPPVTEGASDSKKTGTLLIVLTFVAVITAYLMKLLELCLPCYLYAHHMELLTLSWQDGQKLITLTIMFCIGI
jgi:hypothetical protein